MAVDSPPGGWFVLAESNGYFFNDARCNDVLMYASESQQNILIGVKGFTDQSTIRLTKDSVIINKPLLVTSGTIGSCNNTIDVAGVILRDSNIYATTTRASNIYTSNLLASNLSTSYVLINSNIALYSSKFGCLDLQNQMGHLQIAIGSSNTLLLHNSLLPADGYDVDIGSFDSPIRHLYVGGNTIFVGSNAIKSDSNGVRFVNASTCNLVKLYTDQVQIGSNENYSVIRQDPTTGEIEFVKCSMSNGVSTEIMVQSFSSLGTGLRSNINTSNIHLLDGLVGLLTLSADDGNLVLSNQRGPPTIIGISSNCIGIGTSNPIATLHVKGDSYIQGSLGAQRLHITKQNSAFSPSARSFNSDGLSFYIDDYDKNFMFKVGANEVARLTGNGCFGIGTTSPQSPLHVEEHITSNIGTSTHSNWCAYFNGNVLAREYNVFSDKRIKTDFQEIDRNKALSLAMQLPVCSYKLAYSTNDNAEKIGFVAQDVETVFPNCVKSIQGFVPDILQEALLIKTGKHLYKLKFPGCFTAVNDLNLPTTLKIILKNNKTTIIQALKLNDSELTISCFEEFDEQTVFVYGSQVNDFKVINYEQITALLTASIQNLSKELTETKALVNHLVYRHQN